MKRRLFNFAAAVSLVLALSTAALWVRTRWCNDQVLIQYVTDPPDGSDVQWSEATLATAGTQVAIGIAWQTAMLKRENRPLPGVFHRVEPQTGGGFGGGGGRLEQYGFGWYLGRSVGPRQQGMTYDVRRFSVFAPLWFVFTISLIVPSLWLVSRWRRSRTNKGFVCAVCGYDLRATPNRCPECGTAPEPAQSAA